MKNILIVEDESRIREFISAYFCNEGYTVFEAENGKIALDIFKNNVIDLIILDIMMPEIDGFEVCKSIRETSEVPIIILTALEEEEQHILGYELGADDYITKPVKVRILLAKANRLLKKTSNNTIMFDNIEIDTDARSIYIDNRNVYFAPKEYELLVLLAKSNGKALARDYILDKIWGYYFVGETRVVDSHIKKIRKKLGKYSNIIKTVVSVGYKFEVK